MPLADLIGKERRRQRRRLVLAALSGALAAAAGALLLGLSGWFITGAALAGAAGAGAAFNYLLPAAGIRGLAILRTACRYGERLESHGAALYAMAHIRPQLLAALMRQRPERALALSAGEGAARLVDDVSAVETLFVQSAGTWSAAAALGTGLLLVALANWIAALAVMSLWCLRFVGSLRLARWRADDPGRRLQIAQGRLKDAVASALAGRTELAAYGLVDPVVERLALETQRVSAERVALHRAEGWQAALAAITTGIAMLVTLLLARDAPLPMMALAGLAAGMTLESAGALVLSFQQKGSVAAASERLDAMLTPDPARPFKHPASDQISLRAPDGAWRRLEPGARLAIIGASGCGKTSLLEALVGQRTVGTDNFRVAGLDPIRFDPLALRRLFAYAPQGVSQLAGTVRQNLHLADPKASEADLWKALADAEFEARVRRMPEGLDTWIGETGERLSGGEQRRLGLARAYLRRAPWLVLDEPTEGLDAETEARVCRKLEARLMSTGQGLILVTHRTAPLALCPPPLNLGRLVTRDAA